MGAITNKGRRAIPATVGAIRLLRERTKRVPFTRDRKQMSTLILHRRETLRFLFNLGCVQCLELHNSVSDSFYD